MTDNGERSTGGRLRSTELVWPGKYEEDGNRREVPRANLPFQIIERVNESRATREAKKSAGLSLFDVYEGNEGETFEEGWSNKLIWGDNLYVMGSLLENFAGKVDLIYIDPPFAIGADFAFQVEIGDADVELAKEQSAVEEKAYRDTWGRGNTSYLEMMRARLVLMRELLKDSGSLFLHCDWHLGHYLKVLCDEVFGRDSLVNEIVWCYTGPGSPGMGQFNRKHDNIFWVRKGETWVFNKDDVRVVHDAKTKANFKGGLKGSGFISETYDLAEKGKVPEDWWEMAVAARYPVDGVRRTGYATEKPWTLIERIVRAASSEGDLVADFFCGSGTTLAVAESLGRRWIGCDLGRFATHVTRKRLLGIDSCKPFEILNLGRYERQFWQGAAFGGGREVTERILYEYIAFVLRLYEAEPISEFQYLHGRKGAAMVHVGSVDAPVTIDEVDSALRECAALGQKELHVLGWEWEMGLVGPDADSSGGGGLMQKEARRQGVRLLLLQIPREVMEEQAVVRGDVCFFELAYLEVDVEQPDGPLSARVALKDFVIPNTELIPGEVREKVQKWSDYVDYWAVDWDFRNDSFTQGWVAYRTRKDRSLQLVSDMHEYEGPGVYTVAVKAIDVFGNDTTRVLEVEVGR